MKDLFNEYSIKARLFPALLCLPPFVLLKLVVIDPLIDPALQKQLFVVIAANVSYGAILVYLLSQLNRFVAKILFEDKTKFPTTRMLLPSGTQMSPEFREAIGRRVELAFALTLPTTIDEAANPAVAITRVREIVALIVNKVGHGRLVFQHNVEYGFARNLAGGAVIALVAALAGAAIATWIIPNHGYETVAIGLASVYLLLVLFASKFIDNVGRAYAEILFREYASLPQHD
jgi:hypothetical protein